MDEEILRQALAELARRGGEARAKTLSAKRRREIATKASKAAARARTAKARARKRAGANHIGATNAQY